MPGDPRGVELDADVCHRAAASRDPRFDGRFFVGVTSTGIYCRPICPAPTPRLEHCRFFPSAAAAQAAGFRPCLRCRPEAAPNSPAWLGTSTTVARALRLIEEGALDGGGVAELATRLGVGDRHLRRLFRARVGANPIEVAQTQRLLLAKQLVDGTDLPMTEVAGAAGFRSLRRFNDAFRTTYGRAPRDLRRSRASARGDAALLGTALRLPLRRPYNWPAMLGFLSRRAVPGVEEVAGEAYRRVLRAGGATGVVEVRPSPDRGLLLAALQLPGAVPLLPLAARLRQLFDVDADSERIDGELERDARLRARVRRHRGARVPGAFEPFELAVRAILGQQVSVRAARTLAGRLAEAFGRPLDARPPGSGLRVAFPEPAALAEADLEAIGLPTARAAAVRELARRTASGRIPPEHYLDTGETVRALCDIPGIGAWTAGYVALRASRDPDVMLADDLGVRRALAENGVRPTPAQVLAASEAWRPWRSYAVVYLWLR